MIIAIDSRPLVQAQIQGAQQRARNLLASLVRLGPEHEFHLLYPRPVRRSAPTFDPSLLASLPANFHATQISTYQFPSSFHTASRVLNTLSRTINRIKASVYLSFTPDVPRIDCCPVVPTIHDLSFELDPVVRRTPEGKRLHKVTSHSIRYARRIMAVSSQTKYDIASVYNYPLDKIDVIYNGIDPAFTPAPPTAVPTLLPIHTDNHIAPPYILSVGADIPRRNYARVLAAMQAVWSTKDSTGPRTLWVLAGRDNWPETPIYAAAKKAGALSRIRFVNAPTNPQLADLYRAATITCCASSFEGFGLSVLESMACGTAAACSDMRSLREVAETAAVYFPHDDSEFMGQAIAGLLDDAEYRRQLKYRGIYRASLFTWDTAAQLTLASLSAATEG